jgi:hypothetical protein
MKFFIVLIMAILSFANSAKTGLCRCGMMHTEPTPDTGYVPMANQPEGGGSGPRG